MVGKEDNKGGRKSKRGMKAMRKEISMTGNGYGR